MPEFRFIHAADLHLDSPLQGLESREGTPVDILRGATRRALENLVEVAIDKNVQFIVIAGDVYDGEWKDYSTGLFFRKQMGRLAANNIGVYLAAGNHDAASVISRKLQLTDNVYVFSTKAAESVNVPGIPVVIHGRGFPNRAVPENLVLDYPQAVAGKFNIGVLHTSLNGRPGHDDYAPCSEADLRKKGYGYWALGHIHQPEVISQDPWIVYAGNIQGRHVKETGSRGCKLVIVDESLEVEEVQTNALDVVRWGVVEVNLQGVDLEERAVQTIRQAVGQAIQNAENRLLAARIVLSGATSLHGSFHREMERWRAEVQSIVQDHGGEEIVWVEKVVLTTSPTYDPVKLGERDSLTKTVLETLEDAAKETTLPADIIEMLDALPAEVRRDIEDELEHERHLVMADVQAIILEAIRIKGGAGL